MNKLLLVLGASTVLLTACGSANDTQNNDEVSDTQASIEVYTDKETKCQYLLYTDFKMGGITPRLDNEGKPICGK